MVKDFVVLNAGLNRSSWSEFGGPIFQSTELASGPRLVQPERSGSHIWRSELKSQWTAGSFEHAVCSFLVKQVGSVIAPVALLGQAPQIEGGV